MVGERATAEQSVDAERREVNGRRTVPSNPQAPMAMSLLGLQAKAGNRAVARLVRRDDAVNKERAESDLGAEAASPIPNLDRWLSGSGGGRRVAVVQRDLPDLAVAPEEDNEGGAPQPQQQQQLAPPKDDQTAVDTGTPDTTAGQPAPKPLESRHRRRGHHRRRLAAAPPRHFNSKADPSHRGWRSPSSGGGRPRPRCRRDVGLLGYLR